MSITFQNEQTKVEVVTSSDKNYHYEILVDGKLYPIRYLGLQGCLLKASELAHDVQFSKISRDAA